MDTPVKEGWLYVVKAKVFHDREDATRDSAESGSAEATGRKGSKLSLRASWAAGRKASKPSPVTTRLMLWDMRDGKEMSAPAVKTGEWEVGCATAVDREKCGFGACFRFCVVSLIEGAGWESERVHEAVALVW